MESKSKEWTEKVLSELLSGDGSVWNERVVRSERILSTIEGKVEEALDCIVEGIDGLSSVKVIADAKIVADHLDSGGGWGFLLFKPKEVKARTYLKKKSGLTACTQKRPLFCENCPKRSWFRDKIIELSRLWGRKSPADFGLTFRELSSIYGLVSSIKKWFEDSKGILAFFTSATPPMTRIDWLGGQGQEILDLFDVIQREEN